MTSAPLHGVPFLVAPGSDSKVPWPRAEEWQMAPAVDLVAGQGALQHDGAPCFMDSSASSRVAHSVDKNSALTRPKQI